MNQEDSVKISNNQEQKLKCEFHPECKLKILHFGEKSSTKSRMLCVQCIIESQNNGENLSQFVYMHNFLLDPKNSILKIFKMNNGEIHQNTSKTLDDFVGLLQQFEESIMNQIQNIKLNIQQIRISLAQRELKICNGLKINDVVRQIQLLKQMDSYQCTKELGNLENQLNFISLNISNYHIIDDKVKNNQLTIVSNINDNLKIINKETENFLQQCNYRIIKFMDIKIPEDIKDFPQINQSISDGRQIEYQLLYQGTRDGLNAQAYWSKCNLQSNLLTIMTSKNGNKFGAYSPCQINQSLNSYVQDPTLKSFIFQYNKKEIYKLIRKEAALQCCENYGPIFGGCDIEMSSDFQNGGRSNLGYSYDISRYNILDKTTHLFGQSTPQLQECKVYKVNFH